MKDQPMLNVKRVRVRTIRYGVDLPLSVEARIRRAALQQNMPIGEWIAGAANVMAMVALGEKPPGLGVVEGSVGGGSPALP